jgi:hypothetical protein
MKTLRRATLLGVILAAGALAGCSSATNANSGNTRVDLLTREQIMSVSGVNSLYEVVKRLRPRWLEPRGGDRSFALPTEIVVFQDQAFLGDVEVLGQLSPEMAYELRWLDGATASSTLPGLGSRHVAGAIVLKTTPGGS